MSRGRPAFRFKRLPPRGSHRAESIKTPIRPCAEHLAVDLTPQLTAKRMRPDVTGHAAAALRQSPPLADSFRVAAPCLRIPARSISHQGFQSGRIRIRACRSSMVIGAPAMRACNRDTGMGEKRDLIQGLTAADAGEFELCNLPVAVVWRHRGKSVTARATASSAAPA
jgi:hypothetical protein